MLAIESITIDKDLAHKPISLKHMSCWVSFKVRMDKDLNKALVPYM